MAHQPPIAVTMGEPAGIGAEITLKLWRDHRSELPPLFVLDSAPRLQASADALEIDVALRVISSPAEARERSDALPVLPLTNEVTPTCGTPLTSNAAAVLESIERAAKLALQGEACAVVTNPIQKDVLYAAGFKLPGHTEYLAEIVGGGARSVMMLASPMLRVVPVTVHVSLQHAIDTLASDDIVYNGRVLAASLAQDFGCVRPRIAVAGLNPHAGENGAMGDEESRIVTPAIEALRAQGIDAFGPVPPDALFTARAREGYDAALCMYHDQALIPIKALDFDRAVNVTIGLPIVRTSPDHGTALDIAGKGIADPSSLLAAVTCAAEIARNRAGASS